VDDYSQPFTVCAPPSIFHGKVKGPTLSLLHDVEAHKSLGVQTWRLKARDRIEWTVILREADKSKEIKLPPVTGRGGL
jgi:hypothetical protein